MQHGLNTHIRTDAEMAAVRQAAVGGVELDAPTRYRLERGFGINLSDIRVHADTVADRLTRLFDTDAFATGPHLFFRAGAYQPASNSGFRLLAHEVTHTLQQAGSSRTPASEQEIEADQVATSIADGGAARLDFRPGPIDVRVGGRAPVVQRHESFEHRALGDVPPTEIDWITTRQSGWQASLERETRLMWLWHQSPERVTELDVFQVRPGIGLLRLQPSNLLLTYGELNALPDYIANVAAIETCPKDVLLTILQTIRQESYYRLNQLRGMDTNERFANTVFGPHDSSIGLLNKIFQSWDMDKLTRNVGTDGIDHYTGLLARNACHFAPYSWYRWQSSYLIARDLAQKAYAAKDSDDKRRLETQASTYLGYANHFLQDSFAAGHLINKTLIMQWFVEWAYSTNLFIEDWDLIKHVTPTLQPNLAGFQLYKPGYAGLGTDPQTVQEQPTFPERMALSGVQAYTVDGQQFSQKTAYQRYLTFVSSVITQAAANAVHDAYNEQAVWVSSQFHPKAYQVYGDDTLFTGKNGSIGARITSEAGLLAGGSIYELMRHGQTQITAQQIRERFPTRAGRNAGVEPLDAWSFHQKQWIIDEVFNSAAFLAKRALTQTFPRLLNFTQDQEFAQRWSYSLQNAGFKPVDTLVVDGRLFVAANSTVYELQPNNGDVIHWRSLTPVETGGDGAETHIASDGKLLFAGGEGHVRANSLENWSGQAWDCPLTGTANPVHVLYAHGRLFAGTNGAAHELDPRTGRLLHSRDVTRMPECEVRLATDGKTLFVGCYGWVSGIRLDDWNAEPWETGMTGGLIWPVQLLYSGGMLFAGSNGAVHLLDPATGQRLHSKDLSKAAGKEVRMAVSEDRRQLVVGCHGFASGINLDDWSRFAWQNAMGGKLWEMVDVAQFGTEIYASSNGYVQRRAFPSGTLRNTMQLSFIGGLGDYTPTLTVYPRESQVSFLMVGMHGYVYNIPI